MPFEAARSDGAHGYCSSLTGTLFHVEWWRMCLDEAQIVAGDKSHSGAAELVRSVTRAGASL